MEFEWDENKNASNKVKHGIDFHYAKQVFDDNKRIKFKDNRVDYGEVRWITIGKIMDALLTVVYTIRKEAIRLISARPSNKEEKEFYSK